MGTLAINGGKRVFPRPMALNWPQFDATQEALLRVFRSGTWWRGGTLEDQSASQCGKFERAFAKYHDAKHALAVVNGTVAVELALRAAGVRAGDEVVVPALSFVVSASAVLPLGAVPVFADADPLTCQPSAHAIETAITPRTAAIVIVHFGGYPADLDRICKIARKHRLPLIEDAAHSHGSQWRGRGVGSWGDFGTFSFQQAKSLTAGEGGIVLCRKTADWRMMYRYHHLGRLESKGFYDFYEMASNYRMTDLQGALLMSQLPNLKRQVPQRMKAAKYLGGLLGQIGGVEPLPADKRITRRGFYYFIYRYNAAEFQGAPRDRFLEALRAEGVAGAGRGYGKAIHLNPLFQDPPFPLSRQGGRYRKVRMPVAERLCAEELCTLHHPVLLSDRKTLDRIAEAIAKIKANAGELIRKPRRKK